MYLKALTRIDSHMMRRCSKMTKETLHIPVETCAFLIPKRCFRVQFLCVDAYHHLCVTLCLFCQTRDDFLGQVDVPLNQIPVSYLFFSSFFFPSEGICLSSSRQLCRFLTSVSPMSALRVNTLTLILVSVPHRCP